MRAVNAAQPWSWLVGDARLPGQAVVVLPSELEVAAAVAPGGLDRGLGGGVQAVVLKAEKRPPIMKLVLNID